MVSGYEFKKPIQPKLMMLLEALAYVIYSTTYLLWKLHPSMKFQTIDHHIIGYYHNRSSEAPHSLVEQMTKLSPH